MKRVVTSLVLIFLLQTTVFSQDQKNMVVGGSLTLNYLGINGRNPVQFEIVPRLGYMANPKVMIGIEGGYSYEKDYLDDYYMNEPYIVKSGMIAGFVRYHNKLAGNFRFFIEPKARIDFLIDSEVSIFTISTDIGIMYMIKDKMSIEFKMLTFNYSRYQPYDIAQISLQYQLTTPNIGLLYYF